MDSDYFCYAESRIAELQHQLAASNEAVAREQASVEDLWVRNKDLEARVGELDIETEQMTQVIDSWHESYTRLWADNARLREGLEEINNYYPEGVNIIPHPEGWTLVCIARNALERLDKYTGGSSD